MLWPLVIGLVLSAGVSLTAWRLHLLTRDGAVAAIVVGTLIYGFGGWRWAALLVLFFATSSVLTRVHAGRKSHPEHRRGRSADQVLANGSVAALFAIWHGVSSSVWIATAFAGAIAAATADTWATEIGLLSKSPPRLVMTKRVVSPGTSGGVTWLGTIGGVAGSALIAGAGMAWLDTPLAGVWLAGFLGMALDSIMGELLERKLHVLDNNGVNLIATTAGAVLAVLASQF